VTFEVFNVLQWNLVGTCEGVSSVGRTKVVQRWLTVVIMSQFR